MRATFFLLLGACNAPPVPPGIRLTPLAPTTVDDLVVEVLTDGGDADGDYVDLQVRWYQDGVPRDDLDGDTVPAAETHRGELWVAQVVPRDRVSEGAVAQAEVWIVDSPPVVTVEIAPESPVTSDVLVATATVVDADGDDVNVTYGWTCDGATTPWSGNTVPAGTGVHGQSWEVTVTPVGVGEPATDSVVIDNVLPTVASVAITPDPATVASLLLAGVEGVEDLDDDLVTLRYDWYVDDVLATSGDLDELDAAGLVKHQVVRLEAVPNDGFEDGVAVISQDLEIDDTPPVAGGVEIQPGEAYEATTLTCVPSGYSDLDGDPEGWGYAWEVNGVVVETVSSIDGSVFGRGDVVECMATPNDGELDGDPVRSAALTVLDTAPVLASVDLSTLAPTEYDSVSAVPGTTTDVDGDAVSFTYAWYVNGALVSTRADLTSDLFGRGDSIYVVVTPTDGTLAGAPVSSPTATGANSAPSSSSVAISPTSAGTDDTLTASASADDPDGDAISWTYSWYVDGAASGTGGSLDGSAFVRGQSVYVTALPNDGSADGPLATSAVLVIGNTPPGAPGVAIDPAEPIVDVDLVCSVTSAAVDPDGDAVAGYAYAWTRDGVTWTDVTTTSTAGDTVPGADITESHTWTCSVTASDGTDSGAAGTATATGPGADVSTCGDGVCDGDESCWSCDDDCGSCDCPTEAQVIVYAPSAWNVLADAVAADPSYCADYYIMMPANSGDKTTPRSAGEPEDMRARGARIHAVAEFHWATWSGEAGTWYDKGVAFRDNMEAAGYDVDAGDTWAINELPSTVRSDASTRADALEVIRGLYDGSSGATPSQGIVFTTGMGQDTTNFAVYKPYIEDWLSDATFWSTANLYVDYWAQEVYADPDYTCVPGATVADVSSSLNSYVEHVARHAEIGPSDANTAQSYLGRAYVPLMNAVWSSEGVGYGNTMVDLDTMKMFVSHQVYAARSWSNSHNYPDGRVGFAWARSDGVSDTDLQELAERLASAIHYAYDEGGGSAAGACSPSGAYTWCACEVTGASFNTGWDTFESW